MQEKENVRNKEMNEDCFGKCLANLIGERKEMTMQ